jgi:4-hydroxybenzoate polyprenyltransferase
MLNKPENHRPDKSDIVTGDWVDRILPAGLRPWARLMRLDRPIGTWLLLLPGWWGLALAAGETGTWDQAAWFAVLFGVGAVIMRGAGCIINDLWDRDLDARVARTRTRPLVTGEITPRAAMIMVAALSLSGLGILLQLNGVAILVALASVPLIIIYPLMKRVTFWPQAVLGLTFNFGALIGWATMTGTVASPAWMLYVAGFFWTWGYDTIYAHMDRDDDAHIGVKSSARALGEYTRPALMVFYGLCTLFLFMSLYMAAPSLWAIPGIILIAALFIRQVGAVDIHDPARCLALFKANRNQGLVILGVVLLCAATA